MIVRAQEWSATAEGAASLQDIEVIFKIIFNYAIRLAGIVLFLMLIVGGFKYLTAGGDKEKLQAAQKTITYALAGLILILLGWFILLLIKEFTGVDVTVFEIASL